MYVLLRGYLYTMSGCQTRVDGRVVWLFDEPGRTHHHDPVKTFNNVRDQEIYAYRDDSTELDWNQWGGFRL